MPLCLVLAFGTWATASQEDPALQGLMLLGEYEHSYWADFAAELASTGDSHWLVMPRDIGGDPEEDGCWFRVTERGASLSNRPPAASEDEASIPGAMLRMKSIEITGDAEVVLLIDVRRLTGTCNFDVYVELIAANHERYDAYLSLGDGWASASWSGTFAGFHNRKWHDLGGQEWHAAGLTEFRLQYDSERRAVIFSLDMVPFAEIELPAQTGESIQLLSLLVATGHNMEGDLDIELVDLLLGYD